MMMMNMKIYKILKNKVELIVCFITKQVLVKILNSYNNNYCQNNNNFRALIRENKLIDKKIRLLIYQSMKEK